MRRIRVDLGLPPWTPPIDVEQAAVPALERLFAGEVRRLAALGLRPNKRLRKALRHLASRRAVLDATCQRQRDEEAARQPALDKFAARVAQADAEYEARKRRAFTTNARRWWQVVEGDRA